MNNLSFTACRGPEAGKLAKYRRDLGWPFLGREQGKAAGLGQTAAQACATTGVAEALRASKRVSTGHAESVHHNGTRCRREWRQGTQECVRHKSKRLLRDLRYRISQIQLRVNQLVEISRLIRSGAMNCAPTFE